ncbi:hypothetical protein MUK42_17850, partial [Musa troglodytarum]
MTASVPTPSPLPPPSIPREPPAETDQPAAEAKDGPGAGVGGAREGRVSEGDVDAEVAGGVEKKANEGDHAMDGGDAPPPAPATVFRIRLKQPPSSLRHKMSVPELCRNFSAVAWCAKLNAIACASETCARIPRFWNYACGWCPTCKSIYGCRLGGYAGPWKWFSNNDKDCCGEHFISEEKQGRKLTEHEINDVASLHCSPVSNFSAYVSPEAAAQSAATTTWGSGVTAAAFDPTRGGSVITVVIVEGFGGALWSGLIGGMPLAVHKVLLRMKVQPASNGKVEETSAVSRPTLGVAKTEEVQPVRTGQLTVGAKGPEEGPISKSVRFGSGNAGQGYTSEEVKVLFLILVDLCRRTAGLQHPLPASQVGANNIIIRLHYIDGNYTVLPEVVEASLGPHMQNMPRPRGADAAGLLLRELELHPPAEDWHRRNMFGGPWSDPEDLGPLDNTMKSKLGGSLSSPMSKLVEDQDELSGVQGLWPRKRRFSERDAAFGLKTSVGLGSYLGIMGSRRDVITAVWKTGLDGVWYKEMCFVVHSGKS